jgi:hypothetical protein
MLSNCRGYQRHRWQIFATNLASVVDTCGKFATGVNDAGGKLPPVSTVATGVNDTGGK